MASIDPASLRVVDLKVELSNRGLPVKGKKDELVARLSEALEAEKNSTEKPTTSSEENVETQPPQEKATEVEEAANKSKAPVEEEESVTEQPIEENIVQIEAAAVEKPEEQVVEITREEKKETLVEEPMEVVNEKAKEEVIEKPKEEVTDMPKERVMEESKEKPKQDTPKESMATDRNKRRHSEEICESQEEKRPRVGTEKNDTNDSIKVKSSAFYVKGFVRPLIMRSVQELFSRYGTVKRFWMDSIKTHCYVIYETDAEAKKAYDHIHGAVFPEDTGRTLFVDDLTPEQAETLIQHESAAAEKRVRVDWEPLIEKVKNGESLPPSPGSDNLRKARSIGMGQIARQLAQAAEPVSSTSRQVTIEKPREQPLKEKTLDDLFRKTQAIPALYYLPNTDVVAQEKLKALQNL